MKFRSHFQWQSARLHEIQTRARGTDVHDVRHPAPMEIQQDDSKQQKLAESDSGGATGGSTTLFYRLKGLLSHDSGLSY